MTNKYTKTNRRDFCKQLGLASLAFAVPGCLSPKLPQALILGGTNFLGPAVVQAYLKAGYQVTLFNRGVTNAHLFPQLLKLQGDRAQGKEAYRSLQEQDVHWDVVVDVWPQEPHYVKDALEVLQDKAGHYQFVSSIAVYNSFREVGLKEQAPLIDAQAYEEGNYSANKVLCERLIAQYFPQNHTIVRPGAIVGARDPGPLCTDLIKRFAERSEVLVVDAADPLQFIDAEDIGNFLALRAKQSTSGVYNLVGPAQPLSYKSLVNAIKQQVNPELKIHWVDAHWALNEAKLSPFTEVPFWIPLKDDPEPGFYQIDQQAAVQAGLQYKPLAQTIKDAFTSWKAKDYIAEPDSEAMFGIEGRREDELIHVWLQNSEQPQPS